MPAPPSTRRRRLAYANDLPNSIFQQSQKSLHLRPAPSDGKLNSRILDIGSKRPFVLLLDGPPGAGKSTMLNHLRSYCGSFVEVGRKATTRPRHRGDNDWEFEFVQRIDDHAYDLTYRSMGHTYACSSREIGRALREGMIYALTVEDLQTVSALKSRFPVAFVLVYRGQSEQETRQILQARGVHSPTEIRKRISSNDDLIRKFTINYRIYDYVVLNCSSKVELYAQIHAVIEHEILTPRSRPPNNE